MMRDWLVFLRRLRFPERVILLCLLAMAGSVWAFVAIAGEVLEGDTQRLDERMLQALRRKDDPHVPIGPEWVERVAGDVTALGGGVVLPMVTAAVCGYLALSRKWHTALLVLVAVGGGTLASLALKHVFARPRPSVVPHLAQIYTSSFPSGHSMLSAATWLTLGALLARSTRERVLKVYFLALATVLTGLVGVSRVYLGVHYPTDVLAGWCAGLAWALLCAAVARWLQQRGKVEPGG